MKKLLIFLFTGLIVCSCSNKIEKEFVNKVWIIDSIKIAIQNQDSYEFGVMYPNYIIMPQKDSTFKLYKEQDIIFQKFYIKGDTTYLKKEALGGYNNSLLFKYVPYKFEKINESNSKLTSYDKNEIMSEFYLTNLTDLFNGKPDNNSDLYKRLQKETWYPTKLQLGDEILREDKSPKHYLQQDAFIVGADGQTNFFLKVDSTIIFKYTDNSIYLFDTVKKEFKQSYEVSFGNDYKTEIMNFSGWIGNGNKPINIEFKRIDPTLLVNLNDLPKKERLGCNEYMAELMVKQKINDWADSSFYFDTNTIKLINKDEDKCEYTFSLLLKSKDYTDIYSTQKVLVYYEDDGTMYLKQL